MLLVTCTENFDVQLSDAGAQAAYYANNSINPATANATQKALQLLPEQLQLLL